MGYKSYDGVNNVFSFGYYVLKCRVHKALLKAKLEPYRGFLYSVQVGKPSLVCAFQELYRYLIDDFLIERCQKLHKKDFVFVTDFMLHSARLTCPRSGVADFPQMTPKIYQEGKSTSEV